MIMHFDTIQNFGIFKDLSYGTAIEPFRKYNLIYGWNGSGKSTLTRLFGILGGNAIPEKHQNLKLKVTIDGNQYDEKSIQNTTFPVSVFNEEFIEDHIDWNGTIKSILLLDEKNIGDVKEFHRLKVELFGDIEKKIQGEFARNLSLENDIQSKEKELQKTLSNIAKTVKTNYQLLDTKDNYYLNYDKRRVEILLNDTDSPLSPSDYLLKDELERSISEARPVKKDLISVVFPSYSEPTLFRLAKSVKEVIEREIISDVIDDLKNDAALSSWVSEGLEIHTKKNRNTCAFCGSILTENRLNKLKGHFNDELNKLKNDIEELRSAFHSFMANTVSDFTNTTLYYDEFSTEINQLNSNYLAYSEVLEAQLGNYVELLTAKYNSPFEKVIIDPKEFELDLDKMLSVITQRNNCLLEYESVIQKHNAKCNAFDETIKFAKKRIERHYVYEQSQQNAVNEKTDEILRLQATLQEYKRETQVKKDKYDKLESDLSNETLGAEAFNEKLKMFLGHDEIELEFDAADKGYKIIRNKKEEADKLSEGEKTAIAFIYFITKLKENGKEIKDQILVIDDPVSSFDSNKIFSAYAYMKAECDKAKQVFVLTHNYNFFSLILGWFSRKHIKDPSTKKPTPLYSTYRIENKYIDGNRAAVIADGGESMKQATEYDYIFYTVYSMSLQSSLDKKSIIFCGNICRKLLESFLSFKFPKQRGDLYALLSSALPDANEEIKKERIYKYVNIFSHDKKINVMEQLDSEILDANSEVVIKEILSIIEKLDPTHYQHMLDKVTGDLN